jgi:hypothetical protein
MVVFCVFILVHRSLILQDTQTLYLKNDICIKICVPRYGGSIIKEKNLYTGGRKKNFMFSMKKIMAEYIWLDGRKPTAKLRSKTKIIDGPVTKLEEEIACLAWIFFSRRSLHRNEKITKPTSWVIVIGKRYA